jgi:hypothetical protein
MGSLFFKSALPTCFLALASAVAVAQSSDQAFPTPITSSELRGTIRARDIGDPRQTTYYYAFEGSQGDVFINVVARNLAGSIDVYTADGLRLLTRMVIYPDAETTETGRVLYLRKPERLLLRVEGRTPGDDPANFTVKFAGGFIALAPEKSVVPDKKSETIGATRQETGVRVNSVGTILEVLPKKKVEKTESAAAAVSAEAPTRIETKADIESPSSTTEIDRDAKPQVVVTEPSDLPTLFGGKKPAPATKTSTPKPPVRRAGRNAPPVRKATPPKSDVAEAPVTKSPDPMAGIRLVVELKTGEMVERLMTDVARFSVDKGILTVIGKDGKTTRYSILDVSKVTIQ